MIIFLWEEWGERCRELLPGLRLRCEKITSVILCLVCQHVFVKSTNLFFTFWLFSHPWRQIFLQFLLISRRLILSLEQILISNFSNNIIIQSLLKQNSRGIEQPEPALTSQSSKLGLSFLSSHHTPSSSVIIQYWMFLVSQSGSDVDQKMRSKSEKTSVLCQDQTEAGISPSLAAVGVCLFICIDINYKN